MEGKWGGSCFGGVLSLGLYLNLFTLYSVGQVYFRSNIVSVGRSFGGSHGSGVNRVVLFTVDGLQAGSFFDNITSHPHLTSVVREGRGIWGISEARAPTETRQGHAGLLGGILEDPGAMMSLWKEYPYPFDTVVNQSSASYLLAYASVRRMLAYDGLPDKVKAASYTSGSEFRVEDKALLKLFEESVRAKELPVGEKVFILIHTVSMDFVGHAWHPHTKGYYTIMSNMDDLVARVEKLVNDYYGDNKTLFVLTADHGMTDEGQHGGCGLDEIETPYVVWGTGLKSVGLNLSRRVNQTQFAPFISAALNTRIPTNSKGRLEPFFWTNQTFAWDWILSNLDQVWELSTVKKGKALGLLASVSTFGLPEEGRMAGLRAEALGMANRRQFQNAITLALEGITICLHRISHYEHLEQEFLLFGAAVGIILSILVLLVPALEVEGRIQLWHGHVHLQEITISILVIKGLFGWSLLRLPLLLTPLYLTRILLTSYQNVPGTRVFLGTALAVIGGGWILALVYSSCRWVLSIGLVLKAGWSWLESGRRSHELKDRLWMASVGLLALFPLLPPIAKVREPITMTMGPVACVFVAVLHDWSLVRDWRALPRRDRLVLGTQLGLLLSVSVLTHIPSWLTVSLAWTSLLLIPIPLLIPLSGPSLRLPSIFLALATPFAFMTFGHESVFLALLYTNLRLWQNLDLSPGPASHITAPFHRAWFHIFFPSLAYFGIADAGTGLSFFRFSSGIRSFWIKDSPALARQWLFVVKGGVPVVVAALFFRSFVASKREAHRHFLIILIFSQALALEAVRNVRNTGTYVEIGATLTPVIISVILAAGLWILAILFNSVLPASTPLGVQAIVQNVEL